jgi:hypothetical protein
VAEVFIGQNPRRPRSRPSGQSSLKNAFFTDD